MASKRFKKLPEKTKDLNPEVIEKLLPEVKKNCTTKFDESLDLSFQINNKQKKSEVNIRTVVNLPGGTGKKVKVAVVCEDSKAQEAKDAGADIVGSDEFVEKIKGGELNFEKLICTPGMMIKLSKLGKLIINFSLIISFNKISSLVPRATSSDLPPQTLATVISEPFAISFWVAKNLNPYSSNLCDEVNLSFSDGLPATTAINLISFLLAEEIKQ